MISEIAMLMFLSCNQIREGVKEIIALTQAIAPSSSTARFILHAMVLASNSKPPSYNDDELHQYLADFLSESLYKALK